MTEILSHDHIVTSIEALERVYGQPFGPSIAKETDRVTAHYRAFIETAPFFALASNGPDGLDCSPRGDAPGFVRVFDERTLLIPDRRGNNRIDTLRNIIENTYFGFYFGGQYGLFASSVTGVLGHPLLLILPMYLLSSLHMELLGLPCNFPSL